MQIFTKIRYCTSFEDPVLSGVRSPSILHFPTFTVLLLPALVINWDKEVGGCLQLYDLHTKFCVNQPAGSKVGKGITRGQCGDFIILLSPYQRMVLGS